MAMTVIPLAAGFLAGLIPPWFKWAALAAVLAGIFIAGCHFGAQHVQSEWDAEKAEAVKQALAASEEARRLEQKRASVAQEVQTIYVQKQQRMAADNVSARTELERVRGQLAAVSEAARHPGTTPGANEERVRILSGLLSESLGLSEEGRERVEALDARLSGVQEWIAGVCVK
jgi:hypothetical protein